MKKGVLVLCLLLSLCIGSAALADMEKDFYYDIENGGAVITSYVGGKSNLVIPETLGGYPVTKIGYNAFDGHDYLTSVTLPTGLKNIGWYAFAGCTSLREIKIPYGVHTIGRNAFTGCGDLTEIKIPDSVTHIGMEAFTDCSSLRSLEIPAGVESIGSYTFAGCSSLRSISIKGAKTQVYAQAFLNSYLVSIPDLPDSVTPIDVPSNCVVGCWKGSPAETAAVRWGFTVKYFDADKTLDTSGTTTDVPVQSSKIELPPAKTVPVVSSYVEFINLPQEANKTDDVPDMPVFIQTAEENAQSVTTDQQGNPYTGTFVIEHEVSEVTENKVVIDITPKDSFGNTLKWKGSAELLVTYDDIKLFLGVNRDEINTKNVVIRHEYAKNTYETFSTAAGNANFTNYGVVFKVTSLSPFEISVEPNTANISSVPQTGDTSLPLALLSVLLLICAIISRKLIRREA